MTYTLADFGIMAVLPPDAPSCLLEECIVNLEAYVIVYREQHGRDPSEEESLARRRIIGNRTLGDHTYGDPELYVAALRARGDTEGAALWQRVVDTEYSNDIEEAEAAWHDAFYHYDPTGGSGVLPGKGED